jgi:transcriptional regulator with XRE-family HTH domain
VPSSEQDFYESVGRRIRAHRRARDLTQEQLADDVDLSRTSITNIEQGNQPVSAWLLWRLSAILGCSVNELLPSAEETLPATRPLPHDLPPRVADVVRRLADASAK